VLVHERHALVGRELAATVIRKGVRSRNREKARLVLAEVDRDLAPGIALDIALDPDDLPTLRAKEGDCRLKRQAGRRSL
jgi:hypothetical protein